MRFFLLLFLVLFLIDGNAQDTSSWALEVGAGNYEAFHLGASYDFKNDSQLAFGIGYNFGVSDARIFTVKVEDRFFIMPNSIIFNQTFFSIRALFWTLEDVSYNWYVVSTQFVIGHQFKISDRLKLSVDGGYSLNVYESNKRNNFDELGYPLRNNGVYKLALLYSF